MVIGTISGMIGIGGGAFLMSALIFFYGMSQKTAQGTSVATLLLPIGVFAFWTYYKAGHVDLKLGLLIAIGFAVGGYFGGLWAQHLSHVVLRTGFAVLLVAYGPGIAFLKKDGADAAEIQRLESSHVPFVACGNAMRRQHLEASDLIAGSEVVPAGIVEIVKKQEQGWSYIKAGR